MKAKGTELISENVLIPININLAGSKSRFLSQ